LSLNADDGRRSALSAAVAEGVTKALDDYRKRTERIIPESVATRVVAYPLFDFRVFIVVCAAVFLFLGILIFSGISVEKHIAAIIGLALAAVTVALTFAVRNVTPLQRQILLSLFALAGGAIATEIPGFLNINMSFGAKSAIGAGGALAVFVLLYLFSARKPPN
jgi:hypothetical protein